MSEGELLQLENIFDLSIDSSVYFSILHRKTGVLIGAACQAAGIIAKLPRGQQDALRGFGQSIGLAFQLIDDALDYRSTSADLGKPACSDLKDGKITYPIILLRDRITEEERSILASATAEFTIDQSALDQVRALVAAHKTVEETMELARSYTRSALSELRNAFPPSDARMSIESLGEFLVSRSS
jgi:octaprenyl-diphosphate synthase